MSDVRLTATNPEDSSVVPVACNAKGELLLEEPIAPPEFDGNLDGDLTVSGSASFAGNITTPTFNNNSDSGKGVYLESPGLLMVQRPVSSGDISIAKFFQGKTATIDFNANGSASFSGAVTATRIAAKPVGDNDAYIQVINQTSGKIVADFFGSGTINLSDDLVTKTKIELKGSDGSASFSGDVVVGSRSKQWMLVEQGGLCHMVEQVRATTADLVDPAFGVDPAAAAEYPRLRDVFSELDVIEKALEEVMEKLRMVEPDGWPVWDGSDNS